ncbi:MAG TPA: nitric oxide reductase activation protein [Thiobacillaceae bacterium]|nr:nitric oxide reductase activation protein [Thiobacillaceae bacterium]
MAAAPLTVEEITRLLEAWLDVEFSFHKVDGLAATIATQDREVQDFVLGWVRRIATTNIQVSYEFAQRAVAALDQFDRRVIESWALHATDSFDRSGLAAALKVIREVENFEALRHQRVNGVHLAEHQTVLLNFLHGLSGRQLKLEAGDGAYTDSETLFLPAVLAQLDTMEDNFILAKALVALMWAQTRFGSFRPDFSVFGRYPDPHRACVAFNTLEGLRLEGYLADELPGLYRDLQGLKQKYLKTVLPAGWQALRDRLAAPHATIEDALALLDQAYALAPLPASPFHPELRIDAVHACLAARKEREKILLRVKLAELAAEVRKHHPAADDAESAQFELSEPEEDKPFVQGMELSLDGLPIAPPDDVKQLLTSIQLDWGEVPPEFLVPAGDGEYDPALYTKEEKDPDEVWQGTYHEEGAHLYHEWDHGRQHYRKNWCVLREKPVRPVYDDFVARTRRKYTGLLKHLRRTFEVMRDENRLEKRQPQGEDVDIDALIEALADAHDGSEMSDRLFMHMHRADRNIAVMFMVDMSGSTKGWINEAERESLVLLCETLETLGDRYAIYGFSGTTRKRCEIFRVKTFDEPYNDEARARIAGISPQEYTRMGVAIRHLSKLLNEVDAKTKLLITLSDGKPDDYFDIYRGQYGIEDTRQALFEARRTGIHPFCITIDREAKEYLPYMYGHANFVEIDEVRKLPLKVADIYRRLTS